MVNIDQESAEKDPSVFQTLAKASAGTKGKVVMGVLSSLTSGASVSGDRPVSDSCSSLFAPAFCLSLGSVVHPIDQV